MNISMLICIALFVGMLLCFLFVNLPLGVVAGTAAALLVLAECTSPDTVLNSLGNSNTVTLTCMVILAAGLGRTSFPVRLTSGIRKITQGNYKLAYLGVILIGMLLTSILTSPMAAYAISFPIMDSICDEFGVSRSKAQFPLLVACLACCAILPLGFAISQSIIYDGFMETYGFTQGFSPLDFTKGRWPFLIIIPLWAYFIAPKITPEKPDIPIDALANKTKEAKPLKKFSDVAGIVIFVLVIFGFIFKDQLGLETWYLPFCGVMLMIICGTLTKNEAIKAIPVDIALLFIGANTMATALVDTGTADYIGAIISNTVGNVANTTVIYAVFFIVPFLITQFMQNQSVMNVFAPIALITCSALNADPRGCLVLVTAGSLTAYMTPSATAAVAMCMSAGGYKVKSLFKMSWLLAIILCVCYVAYVSIAMPAF